MKKFFDILGKIVFILIVVGILYVTYYFYSKYYFADFTKAQVELSGTDFYREDKNFCIENTEYNDSVFYKKLDVEPNTGYKVSCKIKTENVTGKDAENNEELNADESLRKNIGACISIIDTEEQSNVVTGNTDFKEVELIFNSKNREEVNIAFRLGSIYGEAIGKAAFSDIKVEKTDVKDNKWKKLDDEKVEVAGIVLEKDEYSIKLKPKKEAINIQALSNNKAIIELDLTLTPELELEGLARDLVRIIQQDRKDANLQLSDRISLSFKTSSAKLLKAIQDNLEYIKNQTLAKELNIVDSIAEDFSFGDEINGEFINIGFSIFK